MVMQWQSEWECWQQEWAEMEAGEKLEDEDFDRGGVAVSGSWPH